MGLLSKVVLGFLGMVALFALTSLAARGLMSAFGFPAALAIVTVIGGWFLLCCVVSLTFGRWAGWNESSRRQTMTPVPGVYMPLTQAQRDAVEWLAERGDVGAYVRNNPDHTIELLKVERGALHRYMVSRTGESTLVEWRPSNWRYPCSRCLAGGGILAIVLGGAAGALVQADVVSFPLVNDGMVKTFAVVLFLTGIAAIVAGQLLWPDPGNYAGPGEWAHIGYLEA